MKKSLILLSLAAFMLVFACKKDDDKSPFDAKYTTEDPEVSKEKVEQNAIELVDQLDALSSATAIEVLMNLNNLQTTPVMKSTANPVMQSLSLISTLKDKSGIQGLFAAMKSAGELMIEDPISFTAMFDSIAGKYTYDFETGEFVETELADQVVFEFPGKETDVTNTAVLTIDNFNVVEITDPLEGWPEDVENELPSSITVDLTYNDVSIAGVSFDATYKSNGMPTMVQVEVYVDDFTFTTKAVHSPFSSASWTNTLKFQDEILVETFIAANGNWSEENIGENITDTTYVVGDEVWTETQVHIEEIIKNANAHVILMNLKVVGTVNIKPLGDAMEVLEEAVEEMTEQEYAQAAVDAINANAQLIVIYRDSNTKIAEAEAYVETYYDEYWETTDYHPAIRFVYADGSKVTAEMYVNSELDGFYESVNDFIDKLNSEYNLDLEYVSPSEI